MFCVLFRNMEITLANFKERLPEIEKAIETATFISIDGEFTGAYQIMNCCDLYLHLRIECTERRLLYGHSGREIRQDKRQCSVGLNHQEVVPSRSCFTGSFSWFSSDFVPSTTTRRRTVINTDASTFMSGQDLSLEMLQTRDLCVKPPALISSLNSTLTSTSCSKME